MNDLKCSVCCKTPFVSVPEEQGSKTLVPVCQLCIHKHSSLIPLSVNTIKQQMYKEVIEDIIDQLESISYDTQLIPFDNVECQEKINNLIQYLNDNSIKS